MNYQTIVNRIAAKGKVTPPTLEIDFFCSDNMGVTWDRTVMVMCADMPMLHSDKEITGVIAHELGHVALQHGGNYDLKTARQHETDADIWAAKLGYGPNLIAVLKTQLSRYGNNADPNANHPVYEDRIAAIKAAMESTK